MYRDQSNNLCIDNKATSYVSTPKQKVMSRHQGKTLCITPVIHNAPIHDSEIHDRTTTKVPIETTSDTPIELPSIPNGTAAAACSAAWDWQAHHSASTPSASGAAARLPVERGVAHWMVSMAMALCRKSSAISTRVIMRPNQPQAYDLQIKKTTNSTNTNFEDNHSHNKLTYISFENKYGLNKTYQHKFWRQSWPQ